MTWRDQAACLGMDQGIFFGEQRGKPYSEAREICGSCEVSEPCLAYALENFADAGMWGGRAPRERTRIRAEDPVSRDCLQCGESYEVAQSSNWYCSRVCQQRRFASLHTITPGPLEKKLAEMAK